MRVFDITEREAGQRLDHVIRKLAPSIPVGHLYKAFRTKAIRRNGNRTEGSERLCAGDQISCYLADHWFVTAQPTPWTHEFLHAGKQLEVLYEDSQILIVHKPSGLLSHPDPTEYCDTLLGRAQRYLYETGVFDPAATRAFTPALVHRLDRNTQGLIIVAKTAPALRLFGDYIRARTLRKYYLCVVSGCPAAGVPEGAWKLLRAWHSKDSAKSLVTIHEKERPGTREILTKYRVLRQSGSHSLLEVELLTGRTHQIRAQFAAIGHALVGDGKYAPRAQFQRDSESAQLLCAYRLVCPDYESHGLEVSVKNVPFLREYFPDFELKNT